MHTSDGMKCYKVKLLKPTVKHLLFDRFVIC